MDKPFGKSQSSFREAKLPCDFKLTNFESLSPQCCGRYDIKLSKPGFTCDNRLFRGTYLMANLADILARYFLIELSYEIETKLVLLIIFVVALLVVTYIYSKNMQRVFEDLLYKYKVDLVFWAHMHSYERTCRVYKGVCRNDGLIHVIVGSAGRGHDTDNWFEESFSVYRELGYGYGKVTVANSTSLLYEWVRNKDKIVRDKVWIHK